MAQNQMLTPELLWKIGRVGLDCVSPDGKYAVYGVQRYDLPKNKSARVLYIVEIQTGATRALTNPEESAGDAEFRERVALRIVFHGETARVRRLGAEIEVLVVRDLEEDDVDHHLGLRLIEAGDDGLDVLVGLIVGDDDQAA